MTVHIILVSYYKDFLAKSINELKHIANHPGATVNFVVVNNNKNNTLDLHLDNTIDLIQGDNSSWEFSAWDQGVDYITKKYTVNQTDVFIFANDTFCHHRFYNLLTRIVFKKSIRLVRNNSKVVVGDICQSKDTLEIYNKSGNKWISTYIFSMQYGPLKSLPSFCNFKHNSEIKLVEQKICSSHINFKLKEHLESWFFSGSGWYASGEATESLIAKKIEAILNEKLLSFLLVDTRDIVFFDIYINRYIKKAHRFLSRKL